MSLLVHLRTRLAGEVLVATATSLLNREIAGELSIRELKEIGPSELVAEGVVVRDAQGREVIRVERLVARPDWAPLVRGVIRVGEAHAQGGEVTLYVSGPDDDTVSLAEAFLPVAPRTGPPGRVPRVVVDGVLIEDVLVHGDVPGFSGLRVEDVRLVGRVDAQHDVRFSVWRGSGVMTGPYPGRTAIDHIEGFFDTNLAEEGLEFYARARRGEDRVRARIVLTRPDPEAAPIMELRAQAEPVHIETLAEMEIAPGLDALRGAVRGNARLFGPTDELRLEARLRTDAGSARIEGRLPSEGALVIEGVTEGLELDGLIPAAPRTRVSGRARIAIDEPVDEGAQTRRVRAELDPLTLDDIVIPGFVMEGLLEDEALVITSFDAPHAGGRTRAEGRIGFDGSLDVHVSARLPDIGRDPNVRRAAPDAQGAVDLALDVRADADAENLRFEGRIALRDFQYGPLQTERLTLRGSGGAELPAPRLRITGDAEELRIGGLSLGRAEMSIRGNGGAAPYALEFGAHDPEEGTRVALSGQARLQGETWRLRAEDAQLDLGDGAWQADVDMALTPGSEIRFEPLALERGGERIRVEGVYRFDGPDDIRVQAAGFELEHLRRLAPDALADLQGTVDGRLELGGDLDRRPEGRLDVRIREGAYGGVPGIGGRVQLELRGDRLTTDVDVALGPMGRLSARGPIRVPPSASRDPSRLIDEARLEDVRIVAENFDVAPLLALAGLDEELSVSGRISTDATLRGSLARPGVHDAVLVLDRVLLEGWDPLRAKLALSFGEGRLSIRKAWLADAEGELARMEADLPLPLEAMPTDLTGFWRLVRREPWSLSVRIAPRRLEAWPEPVASYAPQGLAAFARLTARNENGQMSADFEGVGRWLDPATDDPCAAELRPEVRLSGRLEEDIVMASITGSLDRERTALEAQVAAVLPIDEWVRHGALAEFPSTELFARVLGADMGQIPWLCGYGRGAIHGSITAKDLLTGRSVVGAVVDLPHFQLGSEIGTRRRGELRTDYRVHLRAGSTPERDGLSACAILGVADQEGTPGARCRDVAAPAPGELIARLRVPVTWTPGELIPSYVEGGVITSHAAFERVHVEPVFALIPGIVSGDAVMHGTVSAVGPWPNARLEGELELSDGEVQIEGLGQHLDGITGRLLLRGSEVIFPDAHPLTVRDAGGLATAAGSVRFQGLIPRELDVLVRADAFPIRNEGMVLAWLTGSADIRGAIADDRTTSSIKIQDFNVRLPEQTVATLQPLGLHPEILVVGQPRPAPAGPAESSYPVEIEVDARDPFWVRRSDFAAYVTAQLQAVYRDPNLYVGGEANIRRGTFEIFGKRFELQPGSTIVFDPNDPELDPIVNIAAVYDIPGRRGATVTVTVTGTLTSPELAFSSTETSDRAEIIALLVAGGRRDAGAAEREASEQAASFLAGLTAGILSLGLREEFGDVIPVLAIESEGIGGTRIRLGWNADELIPDFLRRFVTGAYIEGFFTAAGDTFGATANPTGVGGGVSLEFTLPYGLLLRGTYVPVDNGSIDLLFEP